MSFFFFADDDSTALPAPTGPMKPLVATGRRMSEFVVGISAFSLPQHFMEGRRDICDAWTKGVSELGTVEDRVFGQWELTHYDPRTYGSRFYTLLRDFANYLNDRSRRVAWNCFTSCQTIPFDLDHWQRCAEALDGCPNARLLGGNENRVNGYDANAIPIPNVKALLISKGSSQGDYPPPFPEWNDSIRFKGIVMFDNGVTQQTHTHHTSRGDVGNGAWSIRCPKWVNDAKAIQEAYAGDLGPDFPHYQFVTPGDIDEPIACGEQDEPGRTSGNPFHLWQFTAFAKIAGGWGVTAHPRQATPSTLVTPTGRTAECVRAMVAAGKLPLGRCADGDFRHASGLSLAATDRFISDPAPREDLSGTMDSYEMRQKDGPRVEHIALIPGPNWTPVPQGAQIREAYSYAGESPSVFVLERS